MKSLKYAVLLVLVVFMTGCGTKTLTCIQSETEDGTTSTATVIMQFDTDDAITSLEAIAQVKFDDADYWDLVKSLYSESSESDAGYSVVTTLDDNKQIYKMVVSIDLAKISADDLEELGFEDMPNSTYEEVKAEAEEDGYTCK